MKKQVVQKVYCIDIPITKLISFTALIRDDVKSDQLITELSEYAWKVDFDGMLGLYIWLTINVEDDLPAIWKKIGKILKKFDLI